MSGLLLPRTEEPVPHAGPPHLRAPVSFAGKKSRAQGPCRTRSTAAFDEALPAALETLLAGVRAGLGSVQALSLAAETAAEPLGSAWREAVAAFQAGVRLDEGMSKAGPPSDAYQTFVASLAFHQEFGGRLEEAIEAALEAIEARAERRREALAKTAEARLSARLLQWLPLALAAFLLLSRPEMLRPLLTTSLGRIGLAYASASWLVGRSLIGRVLASLSAEEGGVP